LGVIIGILLMLVFSPRRTQQALLITGVVLSIGIVLIFHWMRPEQVIDPIGVEQLTLYLKTLRVPTISWLPSTWAAEAFSSYGEGKTITNIRYSAYLWISTLSSFVSAFILFRLFWWMGRSKGVGSSSSHRNRFQSLRFSIVPQNRPLTFFKRDIITFVRDPSQWTQIIIIAALVAIYVINFKNLPYALYGFQYSMAFVSLGATGLILSAVLARFAYPSVSLESKAFWVLQTAPINWRHYLWRKFFFSLIPALFIGLILISFSLVILDTSRLLSIKCILGTLYICFGLTGLAVGLGAKNPKFEFDDAAEIAVSTGGLFFMIYQKNTQYIV
jgi:ABC-2 type transport system permease protein